MANTYSQILIQAVFAVQSRDHLIKPDWKEELFKYIGGIFRKQNQKLLAVGGVEDHVHILFGLRPNIAISDVLRDVKANSIPRSSRTAVHPPEIPLAGRIRGFLVFPISARCSREVRS